MTRLHRRVSFSDDECSHQFFKVFIPKFNAKKMLLPPVFVRKFVPKSLDSTIVRDSSGKTWDIAVLIRENNVYFDNGWEDFAKDQSLEFGDFLLFTYCSMNLFFDVEIFGKNGCKKEPKTVTHVEAEETESQENGLNVSAKKQGTSEEIRAKGREASSTKFAAPLNRHFSVTITERKANRCNAAIPRRLIREIKFKKSALLRCQNNKLWPVKISLWSDSRGAITAGWPNFHKANSLKANDKCVFEPVLGRGNVCEEINVQIIRKSARKTHHQIEISTPKKESDIE